MKLALLILTSLFFAHSLFAQSYEEIDKKALEFPKTTSVKKLSILIDKEFRTDEEKARALYTWVAHNIKYDVTQYFSPPQPQRYSYTSEEEKMAKEKAISDKLANTTIKRRKAVCQGYATLYKTVCDHIGIECVIIGGTAKMSPKQIDTYPSTPDHAWNAIKLDGKWHLIDVTWGAGYVDFQKRKFYAQFEDGFFMTPPNLFFLNHYPEDDQWLLMNKTKDDFKNLPLYYPTYFSSSIEIIEPLEGIIKKANHKTISFMLKTKRENLKLSYVIGKSSTAQRIVPNRQDDVITFDIPLKKKGFLTIYLDNISLVTYKIK